MGWWRWTGGFEDAGWPKTRGYYESAHWMAPERRKAMVAIIDSVIASGRIDHLAVLVREGNLAVVPTPVPEPPMDVLWVLVGGLRAIPLRLKDGEIGVHYGAVSMRDTQSVRPTGEAVPLFWRYLWEKFGIAAEHSA